MAKILYFARLGEQLKTSSEELSLDDMNTVRQLVDHLQDRGEPWSSEFESGRVLVAVNQEMSDFDSAVSDSDEIAFFPPVTGG
ncbi:MAG TPA: molybdopterin converting factor subunit 1 [Gammaproteobacteria bacterium]|nr:molybdopterin converting factor subunit 1 [Gammaproteobacteria bacterium]